MDTIRDIVIIVFGVTGTTTALIVLIMCFKLYGQASQALERVGRAAEDIHGVAEVGRRSVNAANSVFDVVGPTVLRLLGPPGSLPKSGNLLGEAQNKVWRRVDIGGIRRRSERTYRRVRNLF